MSQKMTDETLRALLYSITHTWSAQAADDLRAHIAAVTAERDEARGAMVLAANERDALRERVREVERERDQWRESRYIAAGERHVAESRLSAIRQRAGESEWVEGLTRKHGVHAAIRYIVGDDATAQTCGNCEDVQPETCATHPEPTTAEAFATVREALALVEAGSVDDVGTYYGAHDSLSLLECRMGAQARILAKWHTDLLSVNPEFNDPAYNALADAPPVFTLEEVTHAMQHAGSDMLGDDTMADFRDYVRERLTALRTPPAK